MGEVNNALNYFSTDRARLIFTADEMLKFIDSRLYAVNKMTNEIEQEKQEKQIKQKQKKQKKQKKQEQKEQKEQTEQKQGKEVFAMKQCTEMFNVLCLSEAVSTSMEERVKRLLLRIMSVTVFKDIPINDNAGEIII